MLTAVLLQLLIDPATPLIEVAGCYDVPVLAFAWTPQGQLLTFTPVQVHEWPSGRSAEALGVQVPEFEKMHRLQTDSSGRRALLHGVRIDLVTLDVDRIGTSAFWEGDKPVRVDYGDGGATYRRGQGGVKSMQGKVVSAISDDGLYALFSDEPPNERTHTNLVKVDTKTGRTMTMLSLPFSTYDRFTLDVSYNLRAKDWLVTSTDGASGFVVTYLATRSRALRLPRSRGYETSTDLEWVSDDYTWALAHRRFFDETQVDGYDAQALDLYNVSTGELIRLVEQHSPWSMPDPGDNAHPERAEQPQIGAVSLDWPRRRLAYAVETIGTTIVYVKHFGYAIDWLLK